MRYRQAGLYFPERPEVSWLADVPPQHRPDSVPVDERPVDREPDESTATWPISVRGL